MLKDAWALAIETLRQVELLRLSERLSLAKSARTLGISEHDAVRYAYGLVSETLRRRNLIDKFISNVIAPKTLSEFTLEIQAFLRLYVYQIRVTKNWAEPNLEEAIRISKLGRAVLGWKKLRVAEPFLGFLLTRQIEPILKAAIDEEQIALRTFQPTWFVTYCFRLFGRKEAIALLEGNIYSPPVFIRLNTLKASQQKILTKLKEEYVEFEKTKLLKFAYKVIESKRSLADLTSYQEGLFYVQDKASCFSAEASGTKPGMSVLDVCAAPGAKTTYLAQLMKNQGEIYSFDYSVRRMNTWKQANQRMGSAIAEPIIADARDRLPINFEADVVFLDPPCTSTGTFGRQPSAKWRLTPKSIENMAQVQWQMLLNCAEKVKPRGYLIYTTNSITVEENELIIERFLKWHPEFHLTKISPQLGSQGLRELTLCQRLYPHHHQSNGLFIAKLQRE